MGTRVVTTTLKYRNYTLASRGIWFPQLGGGRKRTELLAVTPGGATSVWPGQESSSYGAERCSGETDDGGVNVNVNVVDTTEDGVHLHGMDSRRTVNIMDMGESGQSYGVEVEGEFHFAVSSTEFRRLREILAKPSRTNKPVVLTFDRGPRERELSLLQVDGQGLSDCAEMLISSC